MNPLQLFVLNTQETGAGETAQRSYLFSDVLVAKAAGAKLKAASPAEATSFAYAVLPLEGAPA
jgi:hypothetical protein